MRLLIAFIVIPLAIVPIVLAAHPATRESILIVAPAICIAAPAAGFWLGEIVGKTGEGRAALGCLSTMVLFAAYLVWGFAIAPRVIP
jgi:hypothetical protein